MDVHPPVSPIHTRKDFLLHLLTITVGLLIALTLQAAVEFLQHRVLVRGAREDLRNEMEANHERYPRNAGDLRANRDQLARDVEQLRELRDGKQLEKPDLSWNWNWNSFAEAAWMTAKESGALPHMDSRSISKYTWVYVQQEYVNSMALTLYNEEARVNAILVVAREPARLVSAQIDSLLLKTAEIDAGLAMLDIWMKALDDLYTDELAKS